MITTKLLPSLAFFTILTSNAHAEFIFEIARINDTFGVLSGNGILQPLNKLPGNSHLFTLDGNPFSLAPAPRDNRNIFGGTTMSIGRNPVDFAADAGAGMFIGYSGSPAIYFGNAIGTGYAVGAEVAGRLNLSLRAGSKLAPIGTRGEVLWGVYASEPAYKVGTWSIVESSLETPKPRLFGLTIGQNDEHKIRGDIGAQLVLDVMRAKPAWASVAEGNSDSAIVVKGQPEINRALADKISADVYARLDQIKSNIRPGDTFTFYVNAHGGQKSLGAAEQDGFDEYFSWGMSDDDLSAYFAAPEWTGVRKIFLIDSCYAGGWIGNSSSDEGDLEKLTNTAVFMSSKEDQDSYPNFDGYGLWTELALLPALKLAQLTIGELESSISNSFTDRITGFIGKELPLLGINSEGFYDPGSTKVLAQIPSASFYASTDFDKATNVFPTTPVPEPSALWLGLAGLAFLSVRSKMFYGGKTKGDRRLSAYTHSSK